MRHDALLLKLEKTMDRIREKIERNKIQEAAKPVEKNADTHTGRMKWPLKDMEIGDVISLDWGDARSQQYAHVYGTMHGKKFKTWKSRNVIYIMRVG